jgi:hypothetical protein
LCVLGQPLFVSAQTKDSTKVYKKIKKFAYKRKFTKMLYGFVFTEPRPPVDPATANSRSLSNKQKKKDPNARYVGQVIREINIEVHDPFGFSVNDTIERSVSGLQNLGNKAHIRTRNFIVRNMLLFRKNDKVDILEITESERILRQAVFITDARIFLTPVKGSDSVDVKVVVHDRWSWEIWLDLTDVTEGEFTFREYNLGGFGHQFSQYVSNDFAVNEPEYRTRYAINNIGHTYITSNLQYKSAVDNRELGLSFMRPFYSPLTKWAGGVSGINTWKTFNIMGEDSVIQKHPVEYLQTDYWIGRNFNPRKNNSIDNRSRNIGMAVRYYNIHFKERPSFDLDTLRTNLDASLYIGSLSYSVRKFYKDKYIYRFGNNEDVPEGLLIQGLYGILDKEQHKLRYYLGFEVSRGKHLDRLGYLSGSVAYGNFFNKNVRSNITINPGLFYFSDLLKIGRWHFRQFLEYKWVIGINKPILERISFNPMELYGLSTDTIRGSQKMFLNLQTVFYSPYNLIGFNFAPILLIGFGIIQREREELFDTRIYQSYGAGLLIRNENLLVNTFRISLVAYPYTVNSNKHIALNPAVSFSLRLKGFAVGSPSPVPYQ